MTEAPPHPPLVLSPGSTGPDVLRLQQALKASGFDPGELDSRYGPATAEAVKQLQSARGLPADGLVGPRTWGALERPPESENDLSTAVRVARSALPDRVTSFDFARQLLRVHPKYAGGHAGSVELGPPPPGAERRSPDEWLAEIRPLFTPEAGAKLHTRQVLWGLALLDDALAARLRRDGVLGALVAELRPRHADLSKAGHRLAGPPHKETSAPTLLDRPAEVDRLGRRAFAVTLAARLIQLRRTFVEPREWDQRLRRAFDSILGALRLRPPKPEEPEVEVPDGPFLIHLEGAWGVGKSTLLNLFARELKEPSAQLKKAVWGPDREGRPALERWVVVTFNAWQHQRIAPPWWWLMTAVYHSGAAELPRRERLAFKARDHLWRFKVRWPAFVVPLVVVVLVSFFVWWLATETTAFEVGQERTWFEFIGGIAGALSAAFAVLAAGWGAVRGIKRWMLVGTAKGADQFMRTTADPMAAVQRRYEHLVRSIGHPLALFIDDLDRCKADYVVELLEGIQTLFARAPVTYVVAADGGWLRESFLQAYEPFAKSEAHPGGDLGHGFLSKTFQLSTSVPRMPSPTRSKFLAALLGKPEEEDESTRSRELRERAAKAGGGKELREVLVESEKLGEGERQAVREEVVLRQAASDIVAETEYILEDFSDLLEPNPRAMKRLVNAYGFESKVRLLESGWAETDMIATQRLVLWTILKLRWPELAEYLAEHPEDVDEVGPDFPADRIPAALHESFKSDAVLAVVKGDAKGILTSLDETCLRGLLGETAPAAPTPA